MTILNALIFGFGCACIGSLATWLYLMDKYGGRPINWSAIARTFALTLAILSVLYIWRS